MSNKRIEICGNIASGKTTFVDKFHKIEYLKIFEEFKKNPFYEDFYQDPQTYSFETEITFLLQHYHSIKRQLNKSFLICDYAILQDLAYADVNLTGNRHHIFLEIVREIQQELGSPQVIIHLTCPEEILLERIKARSREAEISITVDYLKALAEALSARVKSASSQASVISIQSDLVDFRTGVDDIPEFASI